MAFFTTSTPASMRSWAAPTGYPGVPPGVPRGTSLGRRGCRGVLRRIPPPAPTGTLARYPPIPTGVPQGTPGATRGFRGMNRAVPPMAPTHVPEGSEGTSVEIGRYPPRETETDRARRSGYFEACFLRLIVAFALRAPAP